jgi:hypothetical protein
MALTIARSVLSGAIYKIVMTGFVESGTATSGTLTTLTDTSKSRVVNADAGRCIYIHTGTGTGAVGWVSSNTATVWTVEAFYLPDFQGGVTKISPDNTSQYGLLGTDADVYAAAVAGGWGSVTLTGNTYYFSDCLYIGDGTNKTGIQFTNSVQFGVYGTPRAFASAANTAVVLGRRTKTKSTRNGVTLLQYCTRADSTGSGYGANFGAQWDDLAGYVYVYGSTLKSKLHNVPTPNTVYAAFMLPYKFDFLQSSVDADGFGMFGTILGAFSRSNITNGQGLPLPMWLYSPNVKFDDVVIYASYQGLRIAYNYNGELKNCNLLDNTYPVHLYGAIDDSTKFSGLLRLINTQADLTAILVDTYVTGSIQKEYEWGLNANDGTNPIAGVKVFATNVSGTEVVNTVTDASGNIPTQSIIVQKRTGYAGALTSHAPHTYGFRKYGYFSDGATKTLTSKTDDGVKLRVNPYVVASEATAAAMTGITITSNATSLSSSHSLQDIYDRGQYLSQQSFITEPWTTSDGITFVQSAGRVFTPGAYADWTGKRLAGGTVAFGTPGTTSPRIGTITVQFTAAGSYVMTGADFGGTVTLTNTSGGAVTVELPAGVDYVNTGPSITIVEPQVYQSISVAGGIAGTRLQIFDLSGRGELYNGVPSSWPFTWTDSVPYAADIRFRVRAGKVGKLLVTQEAGTATLSSPAVGFLLAQTDAAIYNSKDIDGSGVSGIAIDDGNLIIELSSGTLVSTTRGFKLRVDAWKLFAYASWWETTEEGIRDEVQTVDAPDGGNIRIYSMGLKNTTSPSYTVEVYGAYVVDAVTGHSSELIDPSGGNICFAPDHVVVQYVNLAPDTAVVTGNMADMPAQVQAGLTAQGLTTTRAAKLDNLDAAVSTASGATSAEIWANATRTLTADPGAAAHATTQAAISALPTLATMEASTLAKDATVLTRLASADYTAPDNAGIAALPTLVEMEASTLAKDATVLTRLAAADYTEPDNTAIAAIDNRLPDLPAAAGEYTLGMSAILTGVNAIPTDPLRVGNYVAPDNAGIAALPTLAEIEAGALATVKAKTDALTVTSGAVDANIKSVRGQPITGTGSESDPWGP